MYRDKSCNICGIVYSPTSPSQKVCSGCYLVNKRTRERRYEKVRRPVFDKVCGICGKDFTTTSTIKKYCGSFDCENKRLLIKSARIEKRRLDKRREYRKNHPIDPFEKLRLPENIVKDFVESQGYSLLSSYKNNRAKIRLLCPEKHVWDTTLHNFKDGGARCFYCMSRMLVSKKETAWLDAAEKSLGRKIFRQRRICGKIVDGYDPETRTIYEFFGNYWHGNPAVFDCCAINKHIKGGLTFGQLFDITIDRVSFFRKSGYIVEIMWEDTFDLTSV